MPVSFFKRSREWPVVPVSGPRGSILVTGIGYKLDNLPGAFGLLPELAESDFVATLRPMPSSEWNRTPVVVWANGFHIGYVNDGDSQKYWDAMQRTGKMLSRECIVKTRRIPVPGQGFQVGKVRLSLPATV